MSSEDESLRERKWGQHPRCLAESIAAYQDETRGVTAWNKKKQ